MKRPARRARELFEKHLVLRFLIVGIGNTMTSFAIYTGFVLLGLHYTLANFLAMVAGIFISYATNGSIVFRTIGLASLLRYIVMWALMYMLQIAIIWAVVFLGADATYGGIPASLLGGFLALLVAVPTSFVIQRSVVFR